MNSKCLPNLTFVTFITLFFSFSLVSAQVSEQKITASGLSGFTALGESSAVSGNVAIFGAPGDASGKGVAIVFEQNGSGTWIQKSKLTASDGTDSDNFGAILDMSDNSVIVGAPISSTVYVYELNMLTDVEDFDHITNAYALNIPYPNPLRDLATIDYKIPVTGRIKIALYNATGQYIRTLKEGFEASGQYQVQIDASGLSRGLYIISLESPQGIQSRKRIIIN